MEVLGRRHGRAFIFLLAAAFAVLLTAGCGARHSAGRPVPLWGNPPFEGFRQVRFPGRRGIDRNALAASLGWWDVTRGNAAAMRIALTFDAGAGAGPTHGVLDTLKANGLACTFFLTGRFAESYPDLVKRIALEGHELGNHSYSHPGLGGLPPEEVASQIDRTEAKVRELTGISTKPYFRFPYGVRSDSLIRQVNSMGYLSVYWTFDSLDSLEGATAEQLRARVSRLACPGAIVLMHCGSEQGALALPGIIADLEAAGFLPVTVTGVLSP